MRQFELREPCFAVRQRRFVDKLHMLLEMRHMGVAEHREALRRQRQRHLDGVFDARLRLMRQAIDQIDVERADARFAQPFRRRTRFLEGLEAIDGALNLKIEILHANAGALDASFANAATVSSLRPRGSISMANSASGAISKYVFSAAPNLRISSGASMVGEPPPQWICVTGWPGPTIAETISISFIKRPR